MRSFILSLILLIFASFLLAQSDIEQTQAAAAAARAARLDAYRQLGEMIQGVKIDSSTTVQDFVTSNDYIKGQYEGFIQGATQEGEAVFLPDGTCEVTLVLTMEALIGWLQTMSQYSGDSRSMQGITAYNPGSDVFRVKGSGAMKIAPVPVMGNIWERVTPQGRLMALRAAKTDAYRNLGEVLLGVRIDSQTVVQDFVAQSDKIKASFNGVVQGAEFVGEPRYKPEGIVEVSAQIRLDFLIGSLQRICRQYPSSRWSAPRFDSIRTYQTGATIQATGSGAPPQKYIMPAPVAPVAPPIISTPVTGPEKAVPIQRPYVPEWADRTVKVTGNGARPPNMLEGQGRLMAERAAQLDAYRLLGEQVFGLELESNTQVQDFVTQYDEVNTKINAYIVGAQPIATRYNAAEGTAEVDMELWLGHVWQAMEAAYRKHMHRK